MTESEKEDLIGFRTRKLVKQHTGNRVLYWVLLIMTILVTIVDQNGARADALCTALFAMGWEKAEAFLLAHPDVHAVLLRDNLKDVLVSEALRDKIQPYDPEVSIRLLKQS